MSAWLSALEDETRDAAREDVNLEEGLQILDLVGLGGRTPHEARTAVISAGLLGSGSRWLALRRAPWFAELLLIAEEMHAEFLEEVAQRRAVEGWDEPVFFQGAQVGLVRKFDSQLLQMRLRGLRPDRYRERQDVNVSAPIHVTLSPTDSKL